MELLEGIASVVSDLTHHIPSKTMRRISCTNNPLLPLCSSYILSSLW